MNIQHENIPNALSVDHSRRDEYCFCPEHNHTHYEISFVTEGTLKIKSGKATLTAAAPCAILHFPGSPHSVESPGGIYERYNINYSTALFERFPVILSCTEALFFTSTAVLPMSRETADNLLRFVRPLFEEYESGGDTDLLGSLLSVVLSFLCRLGEGNRAGERRGSYINKVIRYISDNLSHVMTADEISGEFFVSRAKLSADFKRETGMTLKQYVCLQTIERARTMLSDRKSVQATAIELGFPDSAAFIRTFRRMTGTTPGTFAAEHARE